MDDKVSEDEVVRGALFVANLLQAVMLQQWMETPAALREGLAAGHSPFLNIDLVKRVHQYVSAEKNAK